jgi:hypothetical protein
MDNASTNPLKGARVVVSIGSVFPPTPLAPLAFSERERGNREAVGSGNVTSRYASNHNGGEKLDSLLLQGPRQRCVSSGARRNK